MRRRHWATVAGLWRSYNKAWGEVTTDLLKRLGMKAEIVATDFGTDRWVMQASTAPSPCFQSSGQLRTMFAVASCRSRLRTSKMRLITFIVAIIAASAPASAQGWREYKYPNEGFTVAFPAEPKVETTSYQASSSRLVEARVYSVVQEGGEFKVTVADLSHTEISEGNVMAYAVLMLSRGGEVKIDIPHSTRRIIGRQASIDGVDGSQIYASVFFHNRRLYQISGLRAMEGTVPANAPVGLAIAR
jgi:hypothetical protein